jgi:hypothetical protein
VFTFHHSHLLEDLLVLEGGKELMERGIEEADGDRITIHGLKDSLKVRALVGEEGGESLGLCDERSELRKGLRLWVRIEGRAR